MTMKTPNTEHDDGGPAFPFGQVSELTGQPINGFFNPGASLRDIFAGLALSGWAAGRNNGGDFTEPSEGKAQFVAKSCYQYADAMLAARKERQ